VRTTSVRRLRHCWRHVLLLALQHPPKSAVCTQNAAANAGPWPVGLSIGWFSSHRDEVEIVAGTATVVASGGSLPQSVNQPTNQTRWSAVECRPSGGSAHPCLPLVYYRATRLRTLRRYPQWNEEKRCPPPPPSVFSLCARAIHRPTHCAQHCVTPHQHAVLQSHCYIINSGTVHTTAMHKLSTRARSGPTANLWYRTYTCARCHTAHAVPHASSRKSCKATGTSWHTLSACSRATCGELKISLPLA